MENIQIKKPKLDKREFKFVKLENELVCCLISDKEVDIAAASIDVDVGSLANP